MVFITFCSCLPFFPGGRHSFLREICKCEKFNFIINIKPNRRDGFVLSAVGAGAPEVGNLFHSEWVQSQAPKCGEPPTHGPVCPSWGSGAPLVAGRAPPPQGFQPPPDLGASGHLPGPSPSRGLHARCGKGRAHCFMNKPWISGTAPDSLYVFYFVF